MTRSRWLGWLGCLAFLACEAEIPEPGRMEAMSPPDGGKPRSVKRPPIQAPVEPSPESPIAAPEPEPEQKDALPDAPPKEGMVLLKWARPDEGGRAYGVWLEPVLPSKDPMRGLGAKLLMSQSKLPRKLLDTLDRVRLPSEPSFTVLLTPSYEERILTRWIFNGFENPKALPPKIGQTADQKTGGVTLRAELASTGKIHSLLERKQHNLMTAAFALPARWLAEGDSWTIDIEPDIPQGFDHEAPQRVSEARLLKIIRRDGETLARVGLRVAQRLEGIYLPGSSHPKKMSLDFAFVGQGDFSLEAGGWKTLRGYLHERSQGALNSDDRRLFAVKPLDELPPAARALLKSD